MARTYSGINPVMLKWARERAGRTIEEIAHALNKDIDTIVDWESGSPSSAPTYIQLETLAYSYYKRPVALFFFPSPPDEPDPKQSFRTLPEPELQALEPDTKYAIRQAEVMQLSLRELNEGGNPTERKIFQDLHPNTSERALAIAGEVRAYVGIALEEQMRWKNTDEALSNWRSAIQELGVFIFKRSFRQKDISGFCLIDDEFPIIYLNNSSAASRQIFTIFHELSHILLRTSGVTKIDDRYIESLQGEPRQIEVFCNQFTSEFLVPSEDFNRLVQGAAHDDDTVAKIADRYKVSREVILRKMLNRKMVSPEYYETKSNQWNEEYLQRVAARAGGGNYYATQATYLGDKYLRLAFGHYYQNRCSLEQLADYLNVRVKNVSGLEQFVLRRTPA